MNHRLWLGMRRWVGPFAVLVLMAALLPTLAVRANAACVALFTDPADDAKNTANLGDEENVPQLDILEGGVSTEDAETFTTLIKIKDLKAELPDNATSVNWYFIWTFEAVSYFTRARIDATTAGAAVFSYGTYDPTTRRFSTVDSTAGEFKTGPGGLILVKAPKAGVGEPAAGKQLTDLFSQTYIGQGIPGGPTTLSPIDRGPSGEGFGTPYTMGTCVGSSYTGGGGGGGGTVTRCTKSGTGKADTLKGTSKRDVLCGKGGRDRLYGGGGGDLLIGGKGRDLCVGGPGRDTFKGCERKRQ